MKAKRSTMNKCTRWWSAGRCTGKPKAKCPGFRDIRKVK